MPLWKSGTESLLLVIVELDKWIGSRAVSDLLDVPAPCLQPPAPKSDDIPIPHDQEVIGRKGMTSPHRFYVLELDSRRLQRLPKDRGTISEVAGSVGSAARAGERTSREAGELPFVNGFLITSICYAIRKPICPPREKPGLVAASGDVVDSQQGQPGLPKVLFQKGFGSDPQP